ncbi:CAP domain-containing protein [uncultured Sphingomonas sp.]|uniref:CAP domain-containing protein n=1 Tax=uncultured Sphingomonas sp. TaxID=158754 RepID=UPI0025E201F8|nr:CAP domain-containing protein [uncultured Sphingomonas sp.]
MSIRRFVALLLILSPCAPGEAAGVEWRMARPAPVRDDALLQRDMLDAHNRARGELGLPPLTWSPTLAAAAEVHARELARRGRLFHAAQPAGAAWQGENLFSGTRGGYGYGEMAGYWLAERRYFRNGPSPRFSRTGRWQDAAHYAQMVWRDTTQVGCAMVPGQAEDFLVCRYSPGGEVRGRRAY